ncbi:MAG: prepilin-type N-terminal cleavage/methylation domain-containing protein [Candidatus Saccharimonadales bacterium]|jgi:prepilin-type N-terminal cleavage/methylation domain-containing protein
MRKVSLSQKGFTIVELLIVIVIIGILATIGFVAFSGAQNKANKSKAESTLSQVKSKLGEYYATNNTYPADKAAVKTFLESDEGGNNDSLSTTIGPATGTGSDKYVYACDEDGCDAGFSLTADDSLWGAKPAGDVVVTN